MIWLWKSKENGDEYEKPVERIARQIITIRFTGAPIGYVPILRPFGDGAIVGVKG
jgi:hypothetical protein